jgi:hypothetical protein
MKKKCLAVGIILLFIASEVNPMTLGLKERNKNNIDVAENYSFDRYLYPEYCDCNDSSERIEYEHFAYNNYFDNSELKRFDSGNTLQPLGGQWIMCGLCSDMMHFILVEVFIPPKIT